MMPLCICMYILGPSAASVCYFLNADLVNFHTWCNNYIKLCVPKTKAMFISSKQGVNKTSKNVFRENTCPPTIISSFSMTLKLRSRSPTSNKFLVMSQLYIHENLVRIRPLVCKILCRQEIVMLTTRPTTESAPNSNCCRVHRLGDIKMSDPPFWRLPRNQYRFWREKNFLVFILTLHYLGLPK